MYSKKLICVQRLCRMEIISDYTGSTVQITSEPVLPNYQLSLGVKEAFLQLTQELIRRHKDKLKNMSPDSALSNPTRQGIIALDNRSHPVHLRQRGVGNGDTYITQISGDMNQSARYDTPPSKEKSCCNS